MKLAEALTQIKDIKGKISKLQHKINRKLTVMKLKDDQEIPNNDEIIDQIKELSTKLSALKSRVVATNVKHGLSDKIHELQEAKFLAGLLEPLANVEQKDIQLSGSGFQNQEKYEVLATFDVANVKNLLAENQKRLRDIDLELQKQNWVVDLSE